VTDFLGMLAEMLFQFVGIETVGIFTKFSSDMPILVRRWLRVVV
jgi:hypothetical protein